MNLMKTLRRVATAGAILLVTACGTLPHVPGSNRLPMHQPYRLLLVRPDIQVRELTADGALSFREDWTETARLGVAEKLQRMLAVRAGGTVDVVRSEVAGGDPARVAELHLRHDALGKMMPRLKTVGKSLGDAATELSKATHGELLFIMHADFTVRTTGRKTLIGIGMVGCSLLQTAVLGGVGNCRNPDAGDQSAFASLVDGETGDIIWTTVVTSGVGDPRHAKGAQKLAAALTRRLPDLKPANQ